MKIPAELTNKLRPVTDIFIPKRKYSEAIDSLLKLKSEFSDYEIVDYYLAVSYVNNNQFSDALAKLKKIQNSKQISIVQLTQVNMLMGIIYTENNKLPSAEKAFRNALKINANSSMSHSALGYVLYLKKEYESAIRSFRKAIQIDPNNAGAHNNLGYTLAEIGINVNEAMRECRKAVALYPNSAAYRDSLGYTYLISGDFGQSVKELRKALEFAPANKTIQEHLDKALKKRDANKKPKKK